MPQNTTTENRYSVCIGINTYGPETGLASLSYAENDAKSMDEVLGTLRFASENRVLLQGNNATLANINAALEDIIFDRAKENDLVVFYYAGHGEPVAIGNGPEHQQPYEVFLTTYDFDFRRIQTTPSFRSQHALGMRRLRSTFFEGQEGSRKRLFIFDSCFSGNFSGQGYRGTSNHVQASIHTMLDSSSLGRVFLASCLSYQTATESALHHHGLFTYYVLQALNGNDPDAGRSNGEVTVGSLFDYLADHLPRTQRLVRGGVEQDTFVLASYPSRAPSQMQQPAHEDNSSKARLQAMHIDQLDFVHDRLDHFVGRQEELTQLHQRIRIRMSQGGYVILTGDAGQGKRSIIARLIADQDEGQSIYHFVRPDSGTNHPLNLLRNIMARLILKYDLPDYYVIGESFPILCSNFLNVLKAIADKKVQEVMYIDGLDQLEMGSSAVPTPLMITSTVILHIFGRRA